MEKNWVIVTHERPDLDAVAAIWLLKNFGEQKFPGISKAKLKFLGNGGELPAEPGKNVGNESSIFVDCGRGQFDHHPAENFPNECAATLAAKCLGVREHPSLKMILAAVVNDDLRKPQNDNSHGYTSGPLDLAQLVKVVGRAMPPAEVVDWASKALCAKFEEQNLFWQNEKDYKLAKKEYAIGPGNVRWLIVAVHSNNESFSKYARRKGAAIIIQQNSIGGVQIFSNKNFGVKLYKVARKIRQAEAWSKKAAITNDLKTLVSEGKIVGAENWYFHHTIQALFNGSLTAPCVTPTRISFTRIIEIVKNNLC